MNLPRNEVFQAYEAFLKGQTGYLDSNGLMRLGDASGAGSVKVKGVATTAIAANAFGSFTTEGDCEVLCDTGLTPAIGGVLYQSDTAGKGNTSAGTKYCALGLIGAVDKYTDDKLVTVELESDFRDVAASYVAKAEYTAAGDVLVGTGSGTASAVAMTADRVLANDNTNKYIAMTEGTVLGRLTSEHSKAVSAAELRTLLACLIKTGLVQDDVVVATAADTNGVVNLTEQTVLGRLTGGHNKAVSAAELRTLLACVLNADFTAEGDVLIGSGVGTKAAVALTVDRVLANDAVRKYVAMTEGTVLGRLTAEHVKPLSAAELRTLLACIIKTGLVADDVVVGTAADTSGVVNLTNDTILGKLTGGSAKAVSAAELRTLLACLVKTGLVQDDVVIGTAADTNGVVNLTEGTVLGRLTGGHNKAVSAAELRTLLACIIKTGLVADDVVVGTAADTSGVVNLTNDTILGKLTGGSAKAVSAAELRTLLACLIKTGLVQDDVIVGTAADTNGVVNLTEGTLLGRLTGGHNKAVSAAEIRTLINVADGADVTLTAAANAMGPAHLAVLTAQVGIPFIILVDCTAASAVHEVFNNNCPHKLQILDMIVNCTAANGGGTAKANASDNGTGVDITDAVAMAVEHAVARCAVINRAAGLIAANGDLSIVKNAAGDQGWVSIVAMRVA